MHKLFSCSYLGTVESKINSFEFNRVKKYFLIDYYNVNPIEEIEIQIEEILEEADQEEGYTPTKRMKKAEFKRNVIANDNIFLRKAL